MNGYKKAMQIQLATMDNHWEFKTPEQMQARKSPQSSNVHKIYKTYLANASKSSRDMSHKLAWLTVRSEEKHPCNVWTVLHCHFQMHSSSCTAIINRNANAEVYLLQNAEGIFFCTEYIEYATIP